MPYSQRYPLAHYWINSKKDIVVFLSTFLSCCIELQLKIIYLDRKTMITRIIFANNILITIIFANNILITI